MLNDKQFQSYSYGLFKSYFEKFILYKRSKGEKVSNSALSRLKHLNNTLNKYDTLEITEQMAEEILAPAPDVSKVTRYVRTILLRQFLVFLRIIGVKCYQLPLRTTRVNRTQFKPYIFNDDEIVRLANAADNLRKWNQHDRRTEIYPVIIRILVGTGMRISEVLALKQSDIDCDDGVIKAVNCKNNVCRYIPMSNSLKQIIQQYISTIDNDMFLFKSNRTGIAYSYSTVRKIFRKICTEAKIFKTDGKTPNIHSLRHTFCSKSLEQMLSSGMNMYTAIPILAAYVGHVNFNDTESYIHFTEHGYKEFLEKQGSLRKLIPEVNDE